MKNVLVIVAFLLSAVLTGCGSNSKSDGGPNPALDKVLELQAKEILLAPNGTDFYLTMPFKKLIDETYHVELSGFSLEVTGGCMINSIGYAPTTLKFDGMKDSLETLDISGTFDANCTPTGYTLTATQKITSGNLGDTRQVSFSYEYGGGSFNQGYSFYNATTPMEITESDTPYQIKVQLVKDGYVAVGETIKLRPFDNTYGNIADYEATTGSDGYATFEYTSPEVLPASGSSVILTADYFLEDNTTIPEKEIVLNFAPSSDATVDTSSWELSATPDSVSIITGGENRALSVYLSNPTLHAPVEGVEIQAWWFDPDKGTLNTYFATTNSNGQAVFNYTAPESLVGLTDFDITFEVSNGSPALQTDVSIDFQTSIDETVDTTDMQLWVVPDDFNITEGSQTRAIDLYLAAENSVDLPQPGVAIIAEFFDPNYGVLNTYIGTTDVNGHVVFNYTAPEALPNTPLDITFKVLHGQPDLSVDTKVNFIGGQIIDTTNMNLYVHTANIDADSLVGESTEDIDIWIDDGHGNPLEGIAVRAIFFDPDYGHLDKYTGKTDGNGHIIFTYTGPEVNPGNDINITFEIVNGSPTEDVDVLLDF
ncbi:MAG: hypothetical protein PHO65_09350 [Sulfurovum sp.]|nr:hypothetical protein [Sulfurovum sp.]